MTIAEALRQASERLARAGDQAARQDARALLRFLLACEPSYLYAHGELVLEAERLHEFSALLERRAAGVPLQHLTERQEFYGRDFRVSPAALIPRPETELVLEAALRRLPPDAAGRAVDVGTGTGCIAVTLALERPRLRVAAIDISPEALALAQDNARRLGAAVDFIRGDLLAPLPAAPDFDLVISNPPYVAEEEMPDLAPEVREHEPHLALVAGPGGTEIYERLIPQAAARLRPGGWLILELGYRSAASVRGMLAPELWTEVELEPDLAGWQRVLAAKKRAAQPCASA